jgi:hypothetical protein
MIQHITILVPAREPGGLAIVAECGPVGQAATLYLAKRNAATGRWEPQPMPEAWRQSLADIGFNVPMVTP